MMPQALGVSDADVDSAMRERMRDVDLRLFEPYRSRYDIFSESRRLWNEGPGPDTDVVINCGSHQWSAHRCILNLRSNFFRICLNFCGPETSTGIIKLDDDKPEMVELLLEFIYTRKLSTLEQWDPRQARSHVCVDDVVGDNSGDESRTPQIAASSAFYVDLFEIANKYGEEELLEKICSFCKFDRRLQGPEERCWKFIINLLAGLQDLANTLHNLLLQQILVQRFILNLSKSTLSKRAYKRLVQKPALAARVMKDMATQMHCGGAHNDMSQNT